MFKLISNYKNLFVVDVAGVAGVADFSDSEEQIIKIVFSNYPNLVIDNQVLYPFAIDVETGCPILISTSKSVKKLMVYINCFGLPRKHVMKREQERQKLVVNKFQYLRKLRKI